MFRTIVDGYDGPKPGGEAVALATARGYAPAEVQSIGVAYRRRVAVGDRGRARPRTAACRLRRGAGGPAPRGHRLHGRAGELVRTAGWPVIVMPRSALVARGIAAAPAAGVHA